MAAPLVELGEPLIVEVYDLLEELNEMALRADHPLDVDVDRFKAIMAQLMGGG